MVDALLQGRIKGPKLVEQIHAAGLNVPVIVLTVPQNPIEVDPAKGVHAVLSMPFSGFELMNKIAGVKKAFAETSPVGHTRVISVFAPKGGVGKTTIAFNLAVAMAQMELRTVVIDGSVQFGDLRALLKVPIDAPSILDLPTDRISEVGSHRRPLARPLRHRHPARPAADRDGGDDHHRATSRRSSRCCAASTR